MKNDAIMTKPYLLILFYHPIFFSLLKRVDLLLRFIGTTSVHPREIPILKMISNQMSLPISKALEMPGTCGTFICRRKMV
jgi:hypothetical protein